MVRGVLPSSLSGYSGPDEARPNRLLGLAVRELARDLLPERPRATPLAEALLGVFDTVEVNSTFYRLASPTAVARWVEQTPEGFVFTIKASRYLTHVKRLNGIEPYVARFNDSIEPLTRTPKMGPVLWQLPANFRRDDERLAGTLAALQPGRHCFEFRDPSWFTARCWRSCAGMVRPW